MDPWLLLDSNDPTVTSDVFDDDFVLIDQKCDITPEGTTCSSSKEVPFCDLSEGGESCQSPKEGKVVEEGMICTSSKEGTSEEIISHGVREGRVESLQESISKEGNISLDISEAGIECFYPMLSPTNPSLDPTQHFPSPTKTSLDPSQHFPSPTNPSLDPTQHFP
eukprot:Rmarinus@m.9379